MKTPDMGTDKTTSRPSEEDFKAKIIDFTKLQEDAPARYYEVVNELQEFAKGAGEQEVRDQYYKGWIDEDFKQVLKRLGEEE